MVPILSSRGRPTRGEQSSCRGWRDGRGGVLRSARLAQTCISDLLLCPASAARSRPDPRFGCVPRHLLIEMFPRGPRGPAVARQLHAGCAPNGHAGQPAPNEKTLGVTCTLCLQRELDLSSRVGCGLQLWWGSGVRQDQGLDIAHSAPWCQGLWARTFFVKDI